MYPAISDEKWELFFNVLSAWPNVSKACEYAGISRQTVFNYCKADEEFKKRFDEAREQGVNVVEDFAFDRTAISDTMAIFMLKCNKPERYGDKKEINLGGNISVNLNMVLDNGKKS